MMAKFIKVCGLQSERQIDWAIELGYSAIGIVLHPKSVRYCHYKKAQELALYGNKKITTVAVGIKYKEIERVIPFFDYIQLYEYKNIPHLIFAGENYPKNKTFDYFLYDVSRGTGIFNEPPNWVFDFTEKLIISGGLHAQNVKKVIKDIQPFGIDVSSGVEIEKGIKNYALMKNFIEEVQNATS